MLIRTKFYAVVILSILLGVSGTSFVNYVIFKRELQNTLHDRESVVLQKIVNETRGKLDSLYQTVNFIRVNPSTAGFIEEGAHGDDYPQMISTLHSVQAILPTDSSIAVSDASGKILMSSNNISLYQGNIADKGYFASAMDGHLVAAFEPLPGDPSKYNAVISSPVRTPDGITGTVTAFLPADELLNQKFLDTLGYRNENTFFIADKSGNVILERGNSSSGLRYRHDLVYAASAENLSGMLRDGGHMIFFSFLPRTGAFIVSYSPMSYLYRPLHLFRDSNIFMHLVIVCTVAVCAKILLMSVLPRLKQGMDFARTVVSGDISGSLETSGDELGVMFGAFNTMISHLRTALTKAEVMERRAVSANDALAAHNARLEALVTERTKDLEKAHEHTCLMLNMTNEAIIELDGDKNMIFANLSTAKMLGYDEDELKGKDFFSSIRHCHAEGVLCGSDDCGFRRAVSGGEETRLHNIFITNRSGRFIPVSVSVLPEGPQNSGGGTIIAIMDLSAINMKFQEIHDSSPTAIITVRDGMVWKINDNGFAMFGLRPGDRIGKIYADPEQLGAMRSALSRGLQVRDYPAQLYDVNGNRIDALVALHLFIHEGIESTIMWVSDVTALTQAKIMAEKAARARTVFLASMSHEIRTPLNAIMGISEAELQSGLSGETRVSFEKIYSSGSTLLGIINDILDMSKINSGKFEIVPADYDFTSMMSDTIQQNIVRIASKPIKFESSIDENTPARLFGDEIRIRQILNNLLSNAFKYTNEGTVSLDVTCERSCGDAWLSFSVSDTGVGIRREDIPNLFTEYMQFDTTKDLRVGGTGLGLSICKNLVGMMGGEIKVESEYGLGSKFTVRIPQKITEPAPIGRNTAADLRKFHLMKHQAARDFVRAPIPFAKVLIVDDVITNLDVAMVLLAPYKLTAHCVSGGKDAVEAVRREEPRYDIIFMDHMMPDVDGIEAVRIIREEIGTDYARNVPIIALTANAIVGNEDMFLTRGFNAFISKPIDVRKLDRMLRRWVLGEDGTTDRAVPDRTKTQSSPEWSIDGVDAEKGIASFDGEKNYLTVLDSYAKHTLPLLEGLADVSEKSLEEYALAVHGIKGASCGIMAEDAAQMAEELEKAAKRGDSKMVLKLNGKFIASVRKLVTDIQAVTSVRLQNDSKTVKDSPDLGLLGRLLEDCRSFDFGGMDVTLREIENFVYEKDEELVKWLRERIDNLDYGDVLKRLETVLS